MKKYNMNILPPMGSGFRLARAYVPFQIFEKIYEPQKALMKGTIFPELYDPYPKKKKPVED